MCFCFRLWYGLSFWKETNPNFLPKTQNKHKRRIHSQSWRVAVVCGGEKNKPQTQRAHRTHCTAPTTQCTQLFIHPFTEKVRYENYRSFSLFQFEEKRKEESTFPIFRFFLFQKPIFFPPLFGNPLYNMPYTLFFAWGTQLFCSNDDNPGRPTAWGRFRLCGKKINFHFPLPFAFFFRSKNNKNEPNHNPFLGSFFCFFCNQKIAKVSRISLIFIVFFHV